MALAQYKRVFPVRIISGRKQYVSPEIHVFSPEIRQKLAFHFEVPDQTVIIIIALLIDFAGTEFSIWLDHMFKSQ